jgi:hypothetical protein
VKDSPFLGDKFAEAVRFGTIFGRGFYAEVHPSSGGVLRIPNGQIIAMAVWEDLVTTRDLVGQADVDLLGSKKQELNGMASRYANAVPVVKPIVEAIDQSLAQLGRGMVRSEGAWIPAEDYHLKVEARNKMAAELAAKEAAAQKAIEDARIAREAEAGRLEANLHASRVTSGVARMISLYTGIANDSTIEPIATQPVGVASIEKYFPNCIQLPFSKGRGFKLLEGNSDDDVACLLRMDGNKIERAYFSQLLTYEGGKIASNGAVERLSRIIASFDSAIADWLPYGLVTLRARLPLDPEPEVGYGLNDGDCFLSTARPVPQENGIVGTYLFLQVRHF